MRVLFATAEVSPLVSVGGLAEAAAGLVRQLRLLGVTVELVVPDYTGAVLESEQVIHLDVPSWARPAQARSGNLEGVGPITLVDVPGMHRPHPYTDAEGEGWPDNADRFFGFSAAVAALARVHQPDVIHCNDWHTGPVLSFLQGAYPAVFTIHTLGYQGWTSGGWLDRLPFRADAFESYGGTNPLAGAVQIADRVVAVSPSYATDIVTPEGGFGLHTQLQALGDRLIGILNGIDTSRWNPRHDPWISAPFSSEDLAGKEACRRSLADEIGWADGAPIVGMVSRLVEQKGIDLALEVVRFAEHMPFRLVLLGSGDRGLADWARWLGDGTPDRVRFIDGFDRALAHRIFAGSDLLLMPSRFEPCGLAQMQAMEYGTIPVVTPVGGLNDTVIDADTDRRSGTGFVAGAVDGSGVVDALHRAVRAWKQPQRRKAIQRRGMDSDWSWEMPARRHVEVYESVIGDRQLELIC